MISADTDTGDIGSSHDSIVEPTGRGATGGNSEPPGLITIGGTVITKQAIDALLTDALRSKVIPDEHDDLTKESHDLIIGLAEATRRFDQGQARQKGGQATGHKRKDSDTGPSSACPKHRHGDARAVETEPLIGGEHRPRAK